MKQMKRRNVSARSNCGVVLSGTQSIFFDRHLQSEGGAQVGDETLGEFD